MTHDSAKDLQGEIPKHNSTYRYAVVLSYRRLNK